MKYIHCLQIVVWCIFCSACSRADYKYIDLSGDWKVSLDSIAAHVVLPGTLAENKVGIAVKDSFVSNLSEEYTYMGSVVYTKDFEIPDSWENKPLELFMERTKVSTVFFDDSLIGSCKSVSAPHSYLILEGLAKGLHHLKIVVDNTKSLLPLGGSHAYSEHTQANWNGILGDFYIRRLDKVDIRSVKVDVAANGRGEVELTVLNTDSCKNNEIFEIAVYDANGKECLRNKQSFEVATGKSSLQLSFNLSNPQFWDEYSPCLYTLQVSAVNSKAKRQVSFGIRDFKANGSKFENNGRIVFLRGKHEGGVFPLIGYASMKKQAWKRYFSIVHSYGLNHVRFHSWCPPEAAFQAADEQGIFLQVELPLWGSYSRKDSTMLNYMRNEGERILEEYGNHPSFVMLSLGNELGGDTLLMKDMVEHLRAMDERHLYAMGSNNFYWDTHTYDCEDFFVSMRNGKGKNDYSTDIRGSFSFADSYKGGIINNTFPETQRCFSKAIEGLAKPVVGHETGQYQVFPDFSEIKRYTGVLKPWNFEVIKKRLIQHGLYDQAEDFLKASGALSALCYREEIEMALRTPGFDGFQLLDLQDYPGQGTALVGILNAFMESKGLISVDEWRNFCNDIVPLARFSKYCWKTGEVLEANIEVAHYGKENLTDQTIICSLVSGSGNLLYSQKFETDLKQGMLNKVADITIPFPESIDVNQKVKLRVTIENTSYTNSWDLWVYKESESEIQEGVFGDVCITRNINVFEDCKAKGLKVLYIPVHEEISKESVGGLFITDFWNYTGFKKVTESMGKESSPGTMGLLINSSHPALKDFPTDTHTNWQWWNLVMNSRPMILDKYSNNFRPIVQVIDNWDRNHRLGLIYEVPHSNGKVLVCSIDLFACKDEIEVKALYNSLLNYLKSL